MAGNFNNIQHVNKRKFLNAFSKLGQVGAACESIGIDRTNHYHWIKDDPEYATAFREAQEMAGDVLEAEAIRRGLEKSDVLLIFALKGAKPDKYKDRTDVTSAGKAIGEIRIAYSDANGDNKPA